MKSQSTENLDLYVGTYTDGDSEGIYRYAFNTETGELTAKKLMAALPNPSFVKISPDGNYLYAVQETDNYDSLGGGVSAFKIHNDTLQLLNSQATGGAHPCHVAVSDTGNAVAVSNYSGGNLALFTTDAGKLNDNRQLIDHKVLDTTRAPHVHMAKFMGNSVFTTDLGLDALKRYTHTDAGYTPAKQASLDLPKGAGPRHFTFGQEGKFLYIISEYSSTISVFQKDTDGAYKALGSHSTLDPDFKGDSFCADIHLSEDGKFLYGSNRGENTIVVFGVDQKTGDLSLVGRSSVEGDWPRNFTLDPTGNFVLVANQRSNNIVVFKRNTENGTLSLLHDIKMSSPVCLEFLK